MISNLVNLLNYLQHVNKPHHHVIPSQFKTKETLFRFRNFLPFSPQQCAYSKKVIFSAAGSTFYEGCSAFNLRLKSVLIKLVQVRIVYVEIRLGGGGRSIVEIIDRMVIIDMLPNPSLNFSKWPNACILKFRTILQ